MARNTIKIIDYERITYRGDDPDIKIILRKENENSIEIELQVLQIKRHNFTDNCDVYLQAFNSRGSGLKPIKVGKIKDLKEVSEFVYTFDNVDKDDARFRFTVCEDGQFKSKKVVRIVGLATINKFFEDDDAEDDDEKTVPSETLLPIKERDISNPFQVEMSPSEKPALILRKDCKMRHFVDNDPVQKILIYSAALRQVLTTYLLDRTYEDCIYKKKWMDLISTKMGEKKDDFPQSYMEENPEGGNNEIDASAQKWIEQVVSTMVSNLADQNGNILIEKYKYKNEDYFTQFSGD